MACSSQCSLAQSVKPTPTHTPAATDEKNKIVDPVFTQQQVDQLPTKTPHRTQIAKGWVLLPDTEADHAKQLCSRPSAPKFQGTWKPTDSDIQTMESRLSRISRLRTQSGIVGVRIEHPDRYYRQYLGIVIDNRKFIFINAFCDDKPPDSWREFFIDVCDGGCSWGVVYDVASGEFSHLEMNGVA